MTISSRRIVAAAAAAVLGAAPAAAQGGDVVPGLTLSTGGIRPGTTTFSMVAVRGDQQMPVGTVTEEVRLIEYAGRPALLRATTVTTPRGTLADTAISAQGTMAPIVHRSHQPTQLMSLEFDGARVRASVTPKDSAEKVEERTFEAPMFDSNAIELVLGALPLAEGWTGTLPFYVHERGGLVRMPARVEGRSAPGWVEGAAPAWKVRLDYPEAPLTYWIDPDTRRVVAQEVDMSARGAVMRMTATGTN